MISIEIVILAISICLIFRYIRFRKPVQFVQISTYNVNKTLNKRSIIKHDDFQFSLDYADKGHTTNIILLHGFNDYHYNDELNEHLLLTKNVYALTFRNYAYNKRSSLSYFVHDFKDYFVELDYVFDQMGNRNVEILAHSTGCLILLIYLYYHPNSRIKRIIFNSPFLEWKDNHMILKNPIIHLLSYFFPMIKLASEIVPSKVNCKEYENPKFIPIYNKVLNPTYDELGNKVAPYIFHSSPIFLRWASNVTWYQGLICKKKLKIPTIVLCTPSDDILNYKDNYKLFDFSEQVSIYSFPNEFHNVLIGHNMKNILKLIHL